MTAPSKAGPVRVLVVDDSAICRAAIRWALERDPLIAVVGEAGDGLAALDLVEELRPAVVTLDLRMPRMDGLTCIERIMEARPTPILVATDQPGPEGVDLSFEAISRGALELVLKPTLRASDAECAALARQVKLVSLVQVLPHHRRHRPAPPAADPRPLETVPAVIGLGASTGGPAALATILAALPADRAPPVVIVQHTGAAFANSLAAWLSLAAGRPVRLAEHDDVLRPSGIVLAPQGQELTVTSTGRLRLHPGAAGALHVPSVDGLFHSLATSYGAAALGVLLTGMGRDGAEGLLAMRARGATTLVQDRASSVIFGMPRAAAELGAATHVLPLSEIARLLSSLGAIPRSLQ